MQNIQSLEKSELIRRTQDLVALERKTTLELIEYFREIERRLLFLDYGCSSLFEFAVKHLGLSEGSAQRRISAMRLIRDVPEAKAKIESGQITLSNASQVQTVFRVAHLNPEEKRETLEKITGMTQKECQFALLAIAPEAKSKLMERDRKISEGHFEMKLVVSKELHDQIDELRTFLSHSLPGTGASDLLKYLVQEELKRQKKKRGLHFNSPSTKNFFEPSEKQSLENDEPIAQSNGNGGDDSTAAPVQIKTIRSRKHIPNEVRREIWTRAQGQCEAQSANGRCLSRHQLELDHIVPHAKGGSDTKENLRLVCRAHNLKHAIECYGSVLMAKYR